MNRGAAQGPLNRERIMALARWQRRSLLACLKTAIALAGVSALAIGAAQAAPVVKGELKRSHAIELTFAGPQTSESADPNPYRDYRFNVIFTNGSKTVVVPGYFAADGNAAETSATSGNQWRVNFVPE